MDFYGTIGPACAQPAILQHMVEAGMTGICMNLSHGPLAAHTDWLAMIRAAGIRQLLIDLQGPELRIGTLAEPVALVEGSSVRLGADGVPCPAALVQAAAPGQQLHVGDVDPGGPRGPALLGAGPRGAPRGRRGRRHAVHDRSGRLGCRH